MDHTISMLELTDNAGDLTIDDIVNSQIEANDARVCICSCKSRCYTKRCPCRAIGVDCTGACNCGTTRLSCKNNKQVREFIYY